MGSYPKDSSAGHLLHRRGSNTRRVWVPLLRQCSLPSRLWPHLRHASAPSTSSLSPPAAPKPQPATAVLPHHRLHRQSSSGLAAARCLPRPMPQTLQVRDVARRALRRRRQKRALWPTLAEAVRPARVNRWQLAHALEPATSRRARVPPAPPASQLMKLSYSTTRPRLPVAAVGWVPRRRCRFPDTQPLPIHYKYQ